jgi:hypothetical protein
MEPFMSMIVGPVTATAASSLLNGGGQAEAAPVAELAKRAALNALVHSYTTSLSSDDRSPVVTRLAQQIAAAAELGQVVTLPQGPPNAGVQDVAKAPTPPRGASIWRPEPGTTAPMFRLA